jgi:Spy/CpxP family protein refolding chaperone
MNRKVIWSIVGSVIVALALFAAITVSAAEERGWGRWSGHRWGHFGPGEYVAHELKLNDAQREQIKTIWQAERPTVAKLVREVGAEVTEMNAATSQGNLDESKVDEIAARQGASIAKLLVEKERLKSKIYTSVLNPEQRTKADELQRHWHERLDRIADRLEK